MTITKKKKKYHFPGVLEKTRLQHAMLQDYRAKMLRSNKKYEDMFARQYMHIWSYVITAYKNVS